MIAGLTETENKFLHQTLIEPLKQKKAQVFLFGSRATGKYKKFSDLDILYIPSPAEPIPSHLIHSILSEIEESRFFYKIDLVNYNELASSYKINVDREKIRL